MTILDDPGTQQRVLRLRAIMADYLRRVTPQERDRRMQIHLAQARGPAANARLLRSSTNLAIRLRRRRMEGETTDGR